MSLLASLAIIGLATEHTTVKRPFLFHSKTGDIIDKSILFRSYIVMISRNLDLAVQVECFGVMEGKKFSTMRIICFLLLVKLSVFAFSEPNSQASGKIMLTNVTLCLVSSLLQFNFVPRVLLLPAPRCARAREKWAERRESLITDDVKVC